MRAGETFASYLGIAHDRSPPTALQLIDRIQRGFPVKALDHISNAVAPGDANFKFLIVPKATLARRKKFGDRLTSGESNRLAGLAKIWAFTKEVWGEDESARAFLFRSHPLLAGQRPIDVVLSSDLGARLVEDILGRLQSGSAA